MSWNPFNWFTRDRVKVLESIAKTALKLFLGKTAEYAWTAIENGVWRAERSGLSGSAKFEQVYNEVKTTVSDPKLYTWLARMAIEIAVGIMKARAGELV